MKLVAHSSLVVWLRRRGEGCLLGCSVGMEGEVACEQLWRPSIYSNFPVEKVASDVSLGSEALSEILCAAVLVFGLSTLVAPRALVQSAREVVGANHLSFSASWWWKHELL